MLCRLSSGCREQGLLSSCGAPASHCGGFSCCRQALGHASFSSWGSQALEHRVRVCRERAWLLCSMWDLPRLGIEPVSPATAGWFFTTEPPGKPHESSMRKSHEKLKLSSLYKYESWGTESLLAQGLTASKSKSQDSKACLPSDSIPVTITPAS